MTSTATSNPDTFFALWQGRLASLLAVYETRRGRRGPLLVALFGFFLGLNIACYWLALITAFPERAFGADWARYVVMEFPVGVLGAAFDGASFFITVWIVRRALAARSELSYVGHLAIDVLIGALATVWVLMVFTVSGWLADMVAPEPAPPTVAEAPAVPAPSEPAPPPQEPTPPTTASSPAPPVRAMTEAEILAQRSGVYGQRLTDAINDPFGVENRRNIYFGVLMGVSAALPTLTHLALSLLSAGVWLRRRKAGRSRSVG